ncbi:MAG: major capsid protein [Candidatus Thorarchaeota archaeon]|jgi:hypothetical protein
MPTVTLLESKKLAQDELVAGIIESIVTVNRFFSILPFDGIDGTALKYNREALLGPVATVGVGDQDGSIGAAATAGSNLAERQAAKDAATFVEITASLTTIMGDAEVNGMIQATRSSDGNDQTGTQLASKAKSTGRKYQDMLVNGDGTNETFPGLLALCAASQTIPAVGANGDPLAFETLDQLMDTVLDKDGQVDYFMLPARTIRSFRTLLRALGGANISEVVTLPDGSTVPSYSGIPMFRNDYLPVDQTTGGSNTTTTIYAGTLDEGGRSNGIAGLTASNASGMRVEDVGTHFDKDERVWRVIWYSGLALFSELGLACASGITD